MSLNLRVVLSILYILSPVDLIPDYIPILGGIDDLAIGLTLIYFLIQYKINQIGIEYGSDRLILRKLYIGIIYSIMIGIPIIIILLIFKLF